MGSLFSKPTHQDSQMGAILTHKRVCGELNGSQFLTGSNAEAEMKRKSNESRKRKRTGSKGPTRQLIRCHSSKSVHLTGVTRAGSMKSIPSRQPSVTGIQARRNFNELFMKVNRRKA